MATNSQRAKAMIDAMVNADVSNAKILRVIKTSIDYKPGVEDPEPSDSVLAGRFVDALKQVVRGNLRTVGEEVKRRTYVAAISAAGDVAEGDL